MSENCLSLNVYRPAYNLPAGSTFPVMVFIHGGEFQSGSGGAPLYDGEFLARVGGVIVVTINYRLGAFGFLPIFNQYDDMIGNFGIRDQEVALRWIQYNIAAFDGDSSKVTLFGADAGCQSVAIHLASLSAQSLFRSAILQSCPFTLPFRNKNEARRVVKRFSSALGCQDNDLNCYREKTTDAILRAQREAADMIRTEGPSLFQFQAWGPTVDQWGMHDPHLLQELLQATSAIPKPVMLGFVKEEGRTSVYRNFPLPISADFFQLFVQTEFPDNWQAVADTATAPYRPSTKQDARDQMVRLLNDYVYFCPGRRLAQQMSSSPVNKRNVWMYSFEPAVTWSPGGSAWPPGGEIYCQDVACGGLDLLYLFNPSAVPESRRLQTESLSKEMALYWSNFAKYGDPNGASANTAPASSNVQATEGSSVSRFRQFTSSHSSFPTRASSVPGSLVRIIDMSNLAPRQPTPPPQPKTVPTQFFFSNPTPSFSGAGFNTFTSPFVNRPTVTVNSAAAAPTATPTVFWPTYVTGENYNPDANQTLVLTQSQPFSKQNVFGQRCDFWETIGF